MPHIPVVNVALAEVRQLLDGQNIENTLYFRRQAAVWEPGSLAGLANMVADWFADEMLPLLSVSLQLVEVFVTDLTTATSGVASYAVGMPIAGGAATESEANSIAACISLRTAKRGRANRGRNYIAGIPNTEVTHNTLSGGLMTNLVAAYNTLRANADVMEFEQVVVSRYSGFTIVNNKKKPTPRVTGLIEPVTNATFTDSTVDSLRTRLPHH